MTRALIIVDVQNDFCEGGSLAVAGGAAVAEAVSKYLARFGDQYDHVVASRDWHVDPGSHFSDSPDYDSSWPPHCVADSTGAEFHPALNISRVEAVFNKGMISAAYSAFDGIERDSGRGLEGWLREHGVDAVDVVGIATDYCVRATALDSVRAGFGTRLLLAMTAGVSPATTRQALSDMQEAGVSLVAA